jgi:hypothetical protein
MRELCFPLLERIWASDRVARAHAPQDAEESSQAAVQCGAELVDALVPSASNDYRTLFLGVRSGESIEEYRHRFNERFPIDSTTRRAVWRVIMSETQGGRRTAP